MTTESDRAGSSALLSRLRFWVLILWAAGLIGTGAELLLLGHTHGFWQLIPLALICGGLVVLVFYSRDKRPYAVRLFQIVQVLFIVGGVVGVYLHFDGKMEFKREVNPGLTGWQLFSETLQGTVPPVLAPAALIHFGLLGLACTFGRTAQSAPTGNSLH